ncbi:hypothetical protein EZI54_15585 [Marinobacter halodurans]|uniref:Uncharacterized protein n=1 Tax=Marinobacter halodurans TaxID=2528979 RepID=A0ABY1ZHQ5_9GAMM|nr:hypothetical protein [Marinobacter halodurans]TBW52915.1 hypothetical protein EZI54_15585 [Marinobacter halodurans]
MAVTQNNVLLERGLLRVTARPCEELPYPEQLTYDVEIVGQEVLQSFPTFDEACQFVDMVAPADE